MIKHVIEHYKTSNELEKEDLKSIKQFISYSKDYLLRTNLVAHFTASCWILNETHDKVLMCYHNIYDSYSWIGGHLDGDSNPLRVALKEAKEETGLTNFKVLLSEPISIEVLTVEGHYKKQKYVPSHLHLNITYLLEASEDEKLIVKSDENSDLKWFKFDELKDNVSEKHMYDKVYQKLIDKVNLYKEKGLI